MPTATAPARPSSDPARTRTVVPSASRTASGPATVPRSRLETPRKPATKAVSGRSYSSSGAPSCSILPPFMTAIRSAIVIASSWSCVTWMKVMPMSCWIRFRKSCICLRSLRSRAPSGSSRRRTRGLHTSARASATRCCWPPESWRGLRRSIPSSSTRCSISSTRPRRFFRSAPLRRRPKATFSKIDRCGKSAYDWKTVFTSRR